MLEQAKHIFDTFVYFWVDYKSKFFCNCLATRWRCDQFFQKSPKSKSDNTFTLKNLSLPLLSASEICLRCTISELWIILLSKLLWFETVIEFEIVSNWSNFESKRIHNFKTVNLRQISLEEVRGNERFF